MQPQEKAQGAAAVVGLFLGVPFALFVGPVLLYNSAVAWRVTSVRALWLLGVLFFVTALIEERLGQKSTLALVVVIALSMIALAVRGLVMGHRTKTSSA